MKGRAAWLSAGLVLLLLGCGHRTERYVLPDQVADFSALYEVNCAGCHGRDGRNGAARPLNDPLFLALIGNERLRGVIANGVPHTAMPAFAQSAGGTLTDNQVIILADQMARRWSRPHEFAGADLPPYSAPPGDSIQGKAVFHTYCSKCHSTDASSLSNPELLALISDQSVRTSVIVGRPDLGIPNWRTYSTQAMSSREISDVVAWLSSQRGGTHLP
jgi:mono/diheme cytochrome c family protein